MTALAVPGRAVITMTVSDNNTASVMLWVTSYAVVRLALQIRWSSKPIFSRVIMSSALKGSSIRRRDGLRSSARQIATRCCMPPNS